MWIFFWYFTCDSHISCLFANRIWINQSWKQTSESDRDREGERVEIRHERWKSLSEKKIPIWINAYVKCGNVLVHSSYCVLPRSDRNKKKPDWIVCGIIPDTILIINSHPLSSVVHFPLVSFNSIVAYASMPICIPTIPTMHNFDASNSFRCCYCTLHRMVLSHSFSILSIVLFVWRWIDENIRQRK